MADDLQDTTGQQDGDTGDQRDTGDNQDQTGSRDTGDQQKVDQKDAGGDQQKDTGQKDKGDSGDKATDWREPIADEKARKFATGFNSIEELAATALKQRQQLSTAIVPPGTDADEKEVRDYWSKMGVPETAEGYKYTIPDDLPATVAKAITPEALKADLEMAHRLNFTQDQTEKYLAYHIESLVNADAGLDNDLKKFLEESAETLRKEWGDEFKANSELAKRAALEFGGDEFIQFLAETVVGGAQLANHPAVMRFMATTGRRMMEASVHLEHGSDERKSLEDRREELTTKIHEARASGNSTLAAKYDLERGALTRELVGSGDIVGTGNRSA